MSSKSQTIITLEQLQKKMITAGSLKAIPVSEITRSNDSNLTLYQFDSVYILFSNVLNYGKVVEFNKDVEYMLSFVKAPNPYGNDLESIFRNSIPVESYEKQLAKLLGDTSVRFHNHEYLERIIDLKVIDLKKRKNAAMLPLIVYVGERLKQTISGFWNVSINSTFFCHEVEIITTDRAIVLSPFSIVKNFLEGESSQISTYIKQALGYNR